MACLGKSGTLEGKVCANEGKCESFGNCAGKVRRFAVAVNTPRIAYVELLWMLYDFECFCFDDDLRPTIKTFLDIAWLSFPSNYIHGDHTSEFERQGRGNELRDEERKVYGWRRDGRREDRERERSEWLSGAKWTTTVNGWTMDGWQRTMDGNGQWTNGNGTTTMEYDNAIQTNGIGTKHGIGTKSSGRRNDTWQGSGQKKTSDIQAR